MLKKLTQFYYPKTVAEASKYLKSTTETTAIIAGGTSEKLRNSASIDALVDITKIKGLNFLTADSKSIKLGATTPMQEVYKSKLSGVSGELLKNCAGKIGSTLLRNSITVGGNISAIFPWSDFPVALMALDATVTCDNGKTQRTLPISEVVESKAGDFLKAGELVTEITIPAYKAGTGAAFAKMAKTTNDYALITVATRLTLANGKIADAKVAVNAITVAPVYCKEAQKMLVGEKPSAALFEKAAAKAVKELKVRKDYRATDEYRKEVCEVMVRRSLEESLEKASK